MRPILAAAFSLLLPLAAAGVDIQTTILSDGVDANLGDGVCDVDGNPDNNVPDPDHPGQFLGQCTLRAALQIANDTPGPDRILLRGNSGFQNSTYQLTLVGAGEDAAATGDLDVTSEVEIVGKGFTQTLLEAKRLKDRIFDVKPGGKLTLRSVSLFDGKTPKADFDPGAPGEVSGGCVRSAGESILDSVFFFRCASTDDGGGVSVIGGTANLTNVIFHTCQAKNEGGAVEVTDLGEATISRAAAGLCRAGTGGVVAARGPLTLKQATLSGNKAKVGGAVAVLGGADATILSSTIVSNGKVNLDATGGTLTVGNSIVSGAGIDCLGAVTSTGGNLEGETSCGFTNTNDQQSQDPLLFPFNFNSGVVPTRAIDASSPATDHGLDGASCEATDARGAARADVPSLGVAVCDAGAYEFQPPPPPTP
jgi:hypothetical protein